MTGDQGRAHEVAFVLGGGGVLGAHEVGMLQALAARSGGIGDRQWVRWLEGWARDLPGPPEADR